MQVRGAPMTGQSYEKLVFERADAHHRHRALNRLQVHDAFDKQLSDELNHEMQIVPNDRACRILVLRGAGDTFCAGDRPARVQRVVDRRQLLAGSALSRNRPDHRELDRNHHRGGRWRLRRRRGGVHARLRCRRRDGEQSRGLKALRLYSVIGGRE